MNESKATAKHLDAAYRAMGLSPASSRPLSCCITELKEQLAESQRQLAAVTEELKSRSKERIEALNQVREYQKEFHILSQQCARFSSL